MSTLSYIKSLRDAYTLYYLLLRRLQNAVLVQLIGVHEWCIAEMEGDLIVFLKRGVSFARA